MFAERRIKGADWSQGLLPISILAKKVGFSNNDHQNFTLTLGIPYPPHPPPSTTTTYLEIIPNNYQVFFVFP